MPQLEPKTFPQQNPHSMTGFGRGTASSRQVSVQVELKTLNNKFLEVRPKLPKAFSTWESVCRSRISRSLRRGSVDVSVSYQVLDPQLMHPINEAALKAYAMGIEETAAKLGVESGLNVTALLRLPGVLTMDEGMVIGESDRGSIYHLLDQALDEALYELLEMRSREGKAIIEALRREIEAVSRAEREIRALAPEISARQRDRVRKRVAEALAETKTAVDEGRFLQEVAFYADRADVAEEIDRLASHARQFAELLAPKNGFAIGKQLDFIVQELLREANTIGSKTDDLRVTDLVVQLKLAIDRLREQVQNLE